MLHHKQPKSNFVRVWLFCFFSPLLQCGMGGMGMPPCFVWEHCKEKGRERNSFSLPSVLCLFCGRIPSKPPHPMLDNGAFVFVCLNAWVAVILADRELPVADAPPSTQRRYLIATYLPVVKVPLVALPAPSPPETFSTGCLVCFASSSSRRDTTSPSWSA